ncbi:uncharacterized protein LOC123211742 [Mangifera indica]|uniref:uncharacterized protein LOC123211742 n=1 Tax=Mangifera indica TaxID=29780 RepID=UPI001CFADF1F|nr:uncharacterized protein LOC123211742 [Mangifera indica]
MSKRRAVTHADLAPSPPCTELGSHTGVFLIVLTILCGLCCFILCLTAEATRSQMIWKSTGSEGKENECVYSGSGKTPLLCALIAFVGLAVAMVVEHMYMLIAVSKSPPLALVSWDRDASPVKSLAWQAGFFFVTTWICFAVAEILLLIGVSIESGHLKNWSRPRPSCLVIKEGLFSAGGVFALMTVFLAAGLYLTALGAEKVSQEHENVRREVVEVSALFVSPPRSPHLTTIARENPIRRDTQLENHRQHPTRAFSPAFTKHSNQV